MIHVTGDTHGDIGYFKPCAYCRDPGWGAEDKIIITGDFGFVMKGEENYPQEKEKLDYLASKPYEILFVDGNHEGFPSLMSYPEEIRYGAPVRRVRDNIFWLQRGCIYTIEGKTIFTMGGAASRDKALKMYEGKYFPEEIPTQEEHTRAWVNLYDHGLKVDYIITHTVPKTFVYELVGNYPSGYDDDVNLLRLLFEIYCEVEFKKWFFGHFHEDRAIQDAQIPGKPAVCCQDQVHTLE